MDFITNLDPTLLIELGIIIIFVIVQFIVFSRNRGSISKLKNIFPEGHELFVDFVPIHSNKPVLESENTGAIEANKVSVIRSSDNHSETFQRIVETSNNYILKNKGNTSFSALETIAERKVDTLESGIESVLPLPLYIGLLGTFTGVIIGLFKIFLIGFTTEVIQNFIGGVLIGMIASAFGLFLTVVNNAALKGAKGLRDLNQYDYFGFIRLNLLPPSHKTMPTDMKSLKYNLSAFNEEFINYQHSLNNTLEDTISRFQELQEVFNNIRSLEPGLKSIGQFIKNNTSLMERQASSLHDVTKKTEALTGQLGTIGTTFNEPVVTETTTTVPEAPSTPTPNVLPIGKELVEKMDASEDVSREISAQINNMYAFLQKALSEEQTTKKNFLNSFTFKLFTFTGILAFLIGLTLGVAYLIKNYPTLF